MENRTSKNELIIIEECSSRNSIVGQILTELELRNGDEIVNRTEFDFHLMKERKK